MKKQIIIIGGGNTFDSYKKYIYFLKKKEIDFKMMKSAGWKNTIEKDLGRGFEVILPRMPNPSNAKYLEWKIWFEKIIPHLEKKVVLAGHSLGGIFLAKYLSENKLPKKILAAFLIAAPYDDKDHEESLADFKLKKDLSLLRAQTEKLFIWQSIDDDVVPFADFEKYKKALPNAKYREFKNKGHFAQNNFSEIVR
jgi:uncharacterized protein